MLSSADVTTAGCLRQYAKMVDLRRVGILFGIAVRHGDRMRRQPVGTHSRFLARTITPGPAGERFDDCDGERRTQAVQAACPRFSWNVRLKAFRQLVSALLGGKRTPQGVQAARLRACGGETYASKTARHSGFSVRDSAAGSPVEWPAQMAAEPPDQCRRRELRPGQR